jgi:hypothetical protein
MLRLNAALWATFWVAFPSKVGTAAKLGYLILPCHRWHGKESPSLLKAQPVMSKTFRRYEILLPRRFNDQQPVPDESLAETVLELRRQFGAVSSETQIIRGLWEQQQSYADDLGRIFVDVPDTPQNRQFFEEYKERLKARFCQIDIWMVSFLIEVH